MDRVHKKEASAEPHSKRRSQHGLILGKKEKAFNELRSQKFHFSFAVDKNHFLWII
jgi:hypothetical protein